MQHKSLPWNKLFIIGKISAQYAKQFDDAYSRFLFPFAK